MLNKYGEVEENASLETYNTYGIKTTTKYLVKPYDLKSLQELLLYLDDKKLKYYILGKGSNVILPDNPFSGVIISLANLNKIEFHDHVLKVEAGALLSNVVSEAIARNLQGLETLGSIPGTIGGALYGNASFYKDITIYDKVKDVEVIRNHELIKVPKEDITISHRHSSFKGTKDIIVSATFALSDGDKELMQEEVKKTREKRMATQPYEYKNAGSVFKNPENSSAGKLIDEAHLKGFHVGDAYVSEKHANFIVNKGYATSQDIKELIKIIKEKVKEKDNIELELEQQIIEWE